MGQEKRGAVQAFAAAMLFSISGVCVKAIPWSPLAINGARGALGALVLALWMAPAALQHSGADRGACALLDQYLLCLRREADHRGQRHSAAIYLADLCCAAALDFCATEARATLALRLWTGLLWNPSLFL